MPPAMAPTGTEEELGPGGAGGGGGDGSRPGAGGGVAGLVGGEGGAGGLHTQTRCWCHDCRVGNKSDMQNSVKAPGNGEQVVGACTILGGTQR